MPEANNEIEIISSKPMMYIDTNIKIPGYTLGILKKKLNISNQTLCHS
jgi:hypothetical protein